MKKKFFNQAKRRKLLAYLFPVQPGVPEFLQSNIRHLIWDIGWWGLLNGSTLSFMTIYAARIGADTVQIGLLTAMPAAINLMLALPVGSFLSIVLLINLSFGVVSFKEFFICSWSFCHYC
jgi:hypothetical protein